MFFSVITYFKPLATVLKSPTDGKYLRLPLLLSVLTTLSSQKTYFMKQFCRQKFDENLNQFLWYPFNFEQLSSCQGAQLEVCGAPWHLSGSGISLFILFREQKHLRNQQQTVVIFYCNSFSGHFLIQNGPHKINPPLFSLKKGCRLSCKMPLCKISFQRCSRCF